MVSGWMRHWSSADGPPPPWARRLEAELQRDNANCFTAEQLDSSPDVPQQLGVLKVAVDRIRTDVATTTGLRLPYYLQGPGPEGEYRCGPGLVVSFWEGNDLETFVARVADEQSEWVSEELADRGKLEEARTWPHCPLHDHSLTPVVVDGEAVWQCRDDGSIRIRIGELPQH
jgi:hypothetical protein